MSKEHLSAARTNALHGALVPRVAMWKVADPSGSEALRKVLGEGLRQFLQTKKLGSPWATLWLPVSGYNLLHKPSCHCNVMYQSQACALHSISRAMRKLFLKNHPPDSAFSLKQQKLTITLTELVSLTCTVPSASWATKENHLRITSAEKPHYTLAAAHMYACMCKHTHRRRDRQRKKN